MKFSRRVMAALGSTLLLACIGACAAAGTTPVTQPHIRTVFIILMENKNWVQIAGSASAPYINNTLLPVASHAELYFNPPLVHPSLPNYLWLEAGTNFGIFNDDPPSVKHNPFVYFDDVTGNGNPNSANCISHVRPFGELATDLANSTVAQ